MRILRTILYVLLVIAISVTSVVFIFYTMSQKYIGGITAPHHISEQGRQFVIDEFGDCSDLPTLIEAIRIYETENFTYDYDQPTAHIQSFDFDTFLKEKRAYAGNFPALPKL